ncbi:MAG: deoxyribose-phosphate aldolase [Ruminiclostridium sp.]|nr:deoxyribose-phosphate aldolase [Ruminiclostridium sp.]
MKTLDKKTLASMIDHTMLKPAATSGQIRQICKEALEYGFASVCINPCFVEFAANELKGSDIKVCTVVGFPLGTNSTETKAYEAEKAVKDGAREVDMVINVGALKEGNLKYCENDIAQVVKASKGALVKVIIETCLLTDDEKVNACLLSKKAGAGFVKTSTGFASGGATVGDVYLMRKTVGTAMGVKASGGIRNLQDALAMIEAGATRLGASSGIAIIDEMST